MCITKKAYKYSSYDEHKVVYALFLIVVIFLANVPAILLLVFLPQGKSVSFELSYLNPDTNYGVIDYSGIENNVYLKHIKNTSWMVYLT